MKDTSEVWNLTFAIINRRMRRTRTCQTELRQHAECLTTEGAGSRNQEQVRLKNILNISIHPSLTPFMYSGQTTLAEEMLINTEESVMANFDFLAREDDLEDEDEVNIPATS